MQMFQSVIIDPCEGQATAGNVMSPAAVNIQLALHEPTVHRQCIGCRGGIRVAMVTGDNQHTAIAVAKGVGMADPSKPILLIDAGRAEPRQPLPDCIQTHFSPHHAPQEGALQSALYAHTGDSQAVAAIYAGQHFQSARESKGSRDQCAQHMFHSRDQHAQHGRGQHAQHAFADSGAQMSLEEFAAIQHALSIQVDPALYCINRHVSFGPDSVRTLTAYAHQYSADSPEETLIEPTLVQPSLAHTPIHPRIQPASVMKNSLRPRKNNFFAPRHPPEPPSTFRKDALFAHHHPPEPPPTSRRLKITDASNGQEVDRLSALSALAEGRMQCAVSGDSFEQLLQQSDVSVLELVMRSAVVFARMKPHQKGQMMDLLGKRGIHQMFQGQPRHIQVRLSTKQAMHTQSNGAMERRGCIGRQCFT